jgi:hypothetical protein
MAKAKTPAKASTTTRARTTSTRKASAKAPAQNKMDAAIDEGLKDASANMQSGMEPPLPTDRREQAVRDQFATADELSAPTEKERQAIEERRVAQEVRGF